MDENGTNTFPFHNLPPELKKTSLKVFPVLFSLSFWIKENSMATLANRNIFDQTQNNQVSSPTVLHIGTACRKQQPSLPRYGCQFLLADKTNPVECQPNFLGRNGPIASGQ